MKFESIEKEKFNTLQEYLNKNSKKLVSAEEIIEGLKQWLKPKSACLTYYNDKEVKLDLDGINIVYLDEKGDLFSSFVDPQKISELRLEKIGDVWTELEKALSDLGYDVTYDDLFKTALNKQLKKQ